MADYCANCGHENDDHYAIDPRCGIPHCKCIQFVPSDDGPDSHEPESWDPDVDDE